jgi:hypothetical protein
MNGAGCAAPATSQRRTGFAIIFFTVVETSGQARRH